jgi:hypothetical protein
MNEAKYLPPYETSLDFYHLINTVIGNRRQKKIHIYIYIYIYDEATSKLTMRDMYPQLS